MTDGSHEHVAEEHGEACEERDVSLIAIDDMLGLVRAPVDDSAHEARTGAHPFDVGLQVERHAALVRHRHSRPFRARHVGKAALGGSVRGERDLQGVGVLDRQAQCPQLTGTLASCTADNARADNDGHDYPLSVPGCVRAAQLPVWVNPV